MGFLGPTQSPELCCLPTGRGGMGATRGAYARAGTEECISCMATVIGKSACITLG